MLAALSRARADAVARAARRPGLAPGVLRGRPADACHRPQRARRFDRRPAAGRAHGRAPRDRRHLVPADRARLHRPAARAAAAPAVHRQAARVRASARGVPGVGDQLLRLAHAVPLPGGAPPRRHPRAPARQLPGVRHGDVDGAARPPAEAQLVRQRGPARLHHRGPPGRDDPRQRHDLLGHDPVPDLPRHRRQVAHQPDGRPDRRRRRDDGRGEPAHDRPVLLAVPEGRRARPRSARRCSTPPPPRGSSSTSSGPRARWRRGEATSCSSASGPGARRRSASAAARPPPRPSPSPARYSQTKVERRASARPTTGTPPAPGSDSG